MERESQTQNRNRDCAQNCAYFIAPYPELFCTILQYSEVRLKSNQLEMQGNRRNIAWLGVFLKKVSSPVNPASL